MIADKTKVSGVAVWGALAKIGLATDGELAEQVSRLERHFAPVDPEDPELIPCDYCGGWSPPDWEGGCPFCGTADDADQPGPETPPGPIQSIKEKTVQIQKPAPETVQSASVELLDRAVAELKSLRREESANAWKIAFKLTQVYESDLWKTRRNEQGDVAYRSFEQFTKTELGIGRKYAQDILQICSRFTEAEILETGPTKLRLVLAAPEKDQKKLLDDIKQGASSRDLERKIRPNSKARHLKKAADQETTPDGKITIAAVEGRKVARLFAKLPPGTKDMSDPTAFRPAVSIKDEPWGHLDLENDVRMWFTILQDKTGEWSVRFVFKRGAK